VTEILPFNLKLSPQLMMLAPGLRCAGIELKEAGGVAAPAYYESQNLNRPAYGTCSTHAEK
jgi:hypothetical protein